MADDGYCVWGYERGDCYGLSGGVWVKGTWEVVNCANSRIAIFTGLSSTDIVDTSTNHAYAKAGFQIAAALILRHM